MGRPEYLKELEDPRITEVILHRENPGPTFALNQVWSKTKAELLGKLDNDCLVSPGWVKPLAQAHRDIEQLGVVACWHFRSEDFDETIAKRKIQTLGGHRVFRHPWVCGSGFLVKRSTYERIGPVAQGDRRHALTGFFMDVALAGGINGWYYPFVMQEHMDDPLSPHCLFKDDASMAALREITYTMRTHNIKTYAQRLKRRAVVLASLHYGPSDPQAYRGWAGRLRRHLPGLDRVRHRLVNGRSVVEATA
jgi:hypothetical protein